MTFLQDIAKASRELRAIESQLPGILAEASEDGGDVLVDEMKQRVISSEVRSALTVKVEAVNAAGAVVSVSPGDAMYIARFLEFGTKAHRVKRKGAMYLGNGVFAKKVRGMSKRPFMRPAADSKENEIAQLIKRQIDAGMRRLTS